MKSRNACNLPIPEKETLREMCLVWTEALEHKRIPEDRLNDAYLEAISTRKGSFPFAVSEICEAWDEIKHMSKADLQKEKERGYRVPKWRC